MLKYCFVNDLTFFLGFFWFELNHFLGELLFLYFTVSPLGCVPLSQQRIEHPFKISLSLSLGLLL